MDPLRRKLDRERKARQDAEKIIEEKSRELYEARLQAEFAVKVKSEFLANMSHELRTPLNAILGFSEMMLSGSCGELSATQRDYLSEIEFAGRRLSDTFMQVMEMSRLQDGTSALDIEPLDLVETIGPAICAAKSRAERAGIRLETQLAQGLSNVQGDSAALLRIVANLLDNAIKFSGDGKRILLTAYADSSGEVRLDIFDQGIGMTPEEVKRATVPFYQADGSLTRSAEGCGLGLSIVKGLTDAQGASFEIFSVLDVVTRASLVFPVMSEAPTSLPACAE